MLFEKPLHLFERDHKGALAQTLRVTSLLEELKISDNNARISTSVAKTKHAELRKESMDFFTKSLRGGYK